MRKKSGLPETLPENIHELKELFQETVKGYESKVKGYESQLNNKEREYLILKDKYKLLKHELYGRKSEKSSSDFEEKDGQLLLFNEAEAEIDKEELNEESFEEEEKIVLEDEKKALNEHIERKKKIKSFKKKGKITFPSHIKRRQVIHELPESEKEGRPKIGEEITEELDIRVEFEVIQHVTPIYGERKNSNLEDMSVVSATRPDRILKGCQASENLIAFILTSKYNDAVPFYRQEHIYKNRYGIGFSRSRFCSWAIDIGRKFESLTELMKEDIRGGPLIQMDETTVQVLKEKGRSPSSKSYMWVMIGTTGHYKKIVLYRYFQSRSGKIPYNLLNGYVGYLQTDGYEGYTSIGNEPGIIHLGCFSHARRYFIKAEKVSKKGNSERVALSFIRQIYLAEDKYRSQFEDEEINENDFVSLRKKTVLPILTRFRKWLDKKKLHVTPKSKLGEAINYTLGQWDKLTKYLDTPYATPDNNFCENAIRPFCVGRKNWLFSDTPQGAFASATIYSLIETAKANELEPYRYLSYILKHFPLAKTESQLRELLPYNLSPDKLY